MTDILRLFISHKLFNLMFAEYEERDRRRRERRKDVAKRRAAKEAALEAARAAIRDREELVAKLEEEMENLEKLLAEWEERQVKEVKLKKKSEFFLTSPFLSIRSSSGHL